MTDGGIKAWYPLPGECTIVLVKESFKLDDEDERITEIHSGLQTEDSKTLMVENDSIVVWFPYICCRDPSECP